MMEVGIFRKELHEMDLINTGNEDYIGTYVWVDIADGHEAVFENSIEDIGLVAISKPNGGFVQLVVRREWCNDFKPLSDL